ncbi:MAG: RHS repeat-associated core domain-containing protein, partial [Thermoguttaceae bacterium]
TVVNHRVFSAYGQLLSQSDPQAADCLFAYTGRPLDQATGLQNNLNRWYEAITGRWLSQDPSGLGPDANPYRYCGNGPTNGADPSGLGQTGDQGQEAPKFLPGRLPNPAFWDLPGSAPRAPTLGYSDGYTPLPKFLPGRNMPNPAFWDPPGSARRAPTPGYSGGYTPLPLRIFPPGKSLSPPRIYVLPPTQMRVPRPPDMDGIPPLPDLPPEPRYQYPNPLFPAPRPLPCSDPPDSPPMSPGGRSKGMV